MVNDSEVNKVLIVSDQAYARKADQRTGGVGTETQIISGEAYNQVNQEKFIPIVTEYVSLQPCLPSFLKTRIYIDLATAERFDEEYEKLLRNIHQLPKIVKPPIGKIPDHLINNTAKPAVKRSAQSKQSSPVKYSGRDQYGFYDEFTYQHVTQRLRWIKAGTFQMGSPEHEIGRENNETLHTVTLTEDFWLADTACTQALWQAVMGDNPSQSNQGVLYPVETVSWNDVDQFINQLNAQLPDWNLHLPTEAEWEYACCAGSRSPFSFGESISTEQANYNGHYPYAGGKQGDYREKQLK